MLRRRSISPQERRRRKFMALLILGVLLGLLLVSPFILEKIPKVEIGGKIRAPSFTLPSIELKKPEKEVGKPSVGEKGKAETPPKKEKGVTEEEKKETAAPKEEAAKEEKKWKIRSSEIQVFPSWEFYQDVEVSLPLSEFDSEGRMDTISPKGMRLYVFSFNPPDIAEEVVIRKTYFEMVFLQDCIGDTISIKVSSDGQNFREVSKLQLTPLRVGEIGKQLYRIDIDRTNFPLPGENYISLENLSEGEVRVIAIRVIVEYSYR